MSARENLRAILWGKGPHTSERSAWVTNLIEAHREEVLREAAPKLRAALREMPAAARERHEEGMLRAALILEEMGIVAGDPR